MSSRQRLWRYVRRYKALLAWGVLCVFIANLGQMIGPIVLRDGIDDLTSGVTQAKLLYYGGVFIGINLVAGFFVFLQRRVIPAVARDVEYDLSNDFYAHLQKLPLDLRRR